MTSPSSSRACALALAAALLPCLPAIGAAEARAQAPAVAADTRSTVVPATIPGTGSAGLANPYPLPLTVSGVPGTIGRLVVRLDDLSHNGPADLDVLLVGPGGQAVMLMSDVGGATPVEHVSLTFADGAPTVPASLPAKGQFAPSDTGAGDDMPAPAPPGPYGTALSAFEGTDPNGTWLLYVVDDEPGRQGRLYGYSLLITPTVANLTPSPIADLGVLESSLAVSGVAGAVTKVTVSFHATHTYDGDLDVTLVAPDGTTVELTTDNGFFYDDFGTSCTPAGRTTFDDGAAVPVTAGVAPFAGPYRPEGSLAALNGRNANGTWRLRIVDDEEEDGGTLLCWALTLTTDQGQLLQPPTGLRLRQMTGRLLTFDWTPPADGPAPDGYILEGGTVPGEALVSVPPVGAPTITVEAPVGTWFTRLRAVRGATVSEASNELPIHVEVPVPPSAPSHPLLTARGGELELTWRNTFEGGAPESLVLEVGGDRTIAVPLPLTERFSFSDVPAGSYTFAVRAVNAAGLSERSETVGSTWPQLTCTSAPLAPANFRAWADGATIFVDWDPPSAGGTADAYVLSVTGSLSATLPLGPLRAVSGRVDPGSYTLSVTAQNACGSGPATTPVTITIP
jgi:subtilisin-like proprotein convertase family protein